MIDSAVTELTVVLILEFVVFKSPEGISVKLKI